MPFRALEALMKRYDSRAQIEIRPAGMKKIVSTLTLLICNKCFKLNRKFYLEIIIRKVYSKIIVSA